MDPLADLERWGHQTTLRPDGLYDVQGRGVLDWQDVHDLWVRLKCWPHREDWLPVLRPKQSILGPYDPTPPTPSKVT